MRSESESLQRARIQRSIDFIESHLTDDLTVDTLAEVACYSPSRFQQLFRQFVGTPVLSYVRDRRLTEAKRDLLSHTSSIARTATRYRYDSAQAFARAFSRFHGISPAEYRRTHAPVRVFAPVSVSPSVAGTPRLSRKSHERQTKEVWHLTLELDMPTLKPEVVQFAIVDADPVPKYATRISSESTRTIVQRTNSMYENPRATLRLSLDMHKCVVWDHLFEEVPGNRIYVLYGSSVHTTAFHMASNAPGDRKWLVTKQYGDPAEPICWCIPFESAAGRSVAITLDQTNALDLTSLFDTYLDHSWIDDPDGG